MKRRGLAVAVLAGTALLATALPAAAGFGGTTVLRTAAAGREIRVGDIAAREGGVVVGWQENAPGGAKRVYMRTSANGGRTWRPVRLLDDRQSRDVEVDTCDGWAFATFNFRVGGRWLVGLDRRALTGPGFEQSAITIVGQSRKPDVTCAGERLVVVWFQKVAGIWRVKLHARGVNDEAKGNQLDEVNLDLGPGTVKKGIAVKGTNDRLYVSFFDGDEHQFFPYQIGDGPDYDILGVPSVALPDAEYGQWPEIGAYADRVVLAYMNEADLRARVSTNGGGVFGPEEILEDAAFASEEGAYPTSADIRGTRIIVAGTIVGGVFELNGEGFIHRSTNDGEDWARVSGSTKNGGTVAGDLQGKIANPRIVQAWDRWIADPATHKLRFQRQ